jgi:hypothetical protein
MIRKIFGAIPVIIFLLLTLGLPQANADSGPRSFAFVNKQYIITAEVGNAHTFILNFINMSDYVIVIQPREFIYKSGSGHFYIGQVFESEHKDTRGEVQKYTASYLLRDHSFVGLTVVGSYHEQDQIDELSVRLGPKRYYLQPMEKGSFEQLAAKIGDLDLKNSSAWEALANANISEMGTVKSTDGTAGWDQDWQGLLSQDGVNPPKIIERPEIAPTNEAKRSHVSGRVRLTGIINKNGEIQDLKVIRGLGKGLDQRVVDAIHLEVEFDSEKSQ